MARDSEIHRLPELAKGLELDFVVHIDPEAFGNGID